MSFPPFFHKYAPWQGLSVSKLYSNDYVLVDNARVRMRVAHPFNTNVGTMVPFDVTCVHVNAFLYFAMWSSKSTNLVHYELHNGMALASVLDACRNGIPDELPLDEEVSLFPGQQASMWNLTGNRHIALSVAGTYLPTTWTVTILRPGAWLVYGDQPKHKGWVPTLTELRDGTWALQLLAWCHKFTKNPVLL